MLFRVRRGWATMRPRSGMHRFIRARMLHFQASDHQSGQKGIEARSNLSMSLEGLTAVFGGICVVTLLVVAWPVFMGLWPLLLVALVHLFLVGWCLRLAWRGNWARETLRVDGDHLIVEQFRLGRQSRSTWPVSWTRVELIPGRLGEKQLFLAFGRRRLELGAFLPVNEREELANAAHHLLQEHAAESGLQTIRIS